MVPAARDRIPRRTALKLLATSAAALATARGEERKPVDAAEIARLRDAPVLTTDFLKDPVTIASVELLKNGAAYFVRVRSKEGAEAITVPNPSRMAECHPIFLQRIAPFFIGKDARQIEALMWELYRHASNYKLQGLALWVGVAAIEMALLELLCQSAQRPLADLFGGAQRRDIGVYYASGNRGNTPAQEIEHLQKLVADSGVRALKFRLGGRMSRNADDPPGRTEALIPLARATFPDLTLYGDSNSSYDAREAIRIGRLMEEHRYAFYEEPCEFDDLWSTKEVADALTIPIAGGEQEYSMHRWQWMIANRAVDLVQPDLHYGGGFLRATRVARMAAAAGLSVVPHMSGGGLGYVDVVHFASFTPNAGPFMEFKGNTDLPIECATSSLKCERGIVRAPAGVGFGVKVDASFVAKAVRVAG